MAYTTEDCVRDLGKHKDKIDELKMVNHTLQGSLSTIQSNLNNAVSQSAIEVSSCKRSLAECGYSVSTVKKEYEIQLSEQRDKYTKAQQELQSDISNLIQEKSSLSSQKKELSNQISKLTEQSKTLCNELDETQFAINGTQHDCMNLI